MDVCASDGFPRCQHDGAERGAPDGRATRIQQPVHASTAQERERILAITNSVEFEQMPPSQRAFQSNPEFIVI